MEARTIAASDTAQSSSFRGPPFITMTSAKAPMTFAELQRRSARISRHSRVCSSIRFRMRILLPSCVLTLWEASLYVQDDWRVMSSRTLNLDVRYDIYTRSPQRMMLSRILILV
jgi:hypothetical protein